MYKCPKCWVTNFTTWMKSTTCMYFPPRYEEIGWKLVNTNPDRNKTTIVINCICWNTDKIDSIELNA